MAAKQESADIIDLLLSRGANVHAASVHGMLTIHVAVPKWDIVKLLKDYGVDITALTPHGRTIRSALGYINSNLSSSAFDDVNINHQDHAGQTVLMTAIHNMSDRMLMFNNKPLIYLMDHGASIKLKDMWDRSAIHWLAYICPQSPDYKMFCEDNIDVVDINHWTPLHIAAKRGNSLSIKALFEAKYDHKMRDKCDRHPGDNSILYP